MKYSLAKYGHKEESLVRKLDKRDANKYFKIKAICSYLMMFSSAKILYNPLQIVIFGFTGFLSIEYFK